MSVFAAATGVGSWPGSTPREAAEIVIGELHQLPHLVEFPDRGVGADLIRGRGAGDDGIKEHFFVSKTIKF